jgi:hypothetical protein
MAAMLNIIVKDDATTPKEFTLNPVSDTPNPFWRASEVDVPIEGQLRFNVSQVRLKNGSFKVTAKLETPVMESIGTSGNTAGYVAPPKVAYVVTSIFTMFCDKRSTVADRANQLKLTVGFLQGASNVSGTGTMNNASAGDTWKNSGRPISDAFVVLTLPS